MVIIEILEQLEKAAQEKHLLYLNAGQELVRQEGIIDKANLDYFERVKEEWQTANRTYRSFLSSFGSERKVS